MKIVNSFGQINVADFISDLEISMNKNQKHWKALVVVKCRQLEIILSDWNQEGGVYEDQDY